jgi:hypothetical protein
MTRKIPFVRDLVRCRRKDYVEAAKEVIATVLLALVPVWLGAIVIWLMPSASVGHFVGEFLSSGEALLVAVALIGPSIYIITKKYGNFPHSLSIHFPQGYFLVVLSLAICMLVTAIFGLQRIYVQAVPNHSEAIFDNGLMQRFSVAILLVTVLSLYVVTVFRNFAEEGASTAMRSDETDFLDEWKKQ